MSTITKDKKVSDMTAGELQEHYGLELRPEVEEELRESVKQKSEGKGITLDEVKRKSGIE